MNQENPFWLAMLANQNDSLPRLVFTDWLEERGEWECAAWLRDIHGFSKVRYNGGGVGGVGVGVGVGVGGDGVGDGGGVGGGGVGGVGGVGVGVGGVGGVGGVDTLITGEFVMQNGLYLIYFPTGYYPLVIVGYVECDGMDLVIKGGRVVANSGVGADWAALAYDGPTQARMHSVAKHDVRVPRQSVVHPLNVDKWREALPEACSHL